MSFRYSCLLFCDKAATRSTRGCDIFTMAARQAGRMMSMHEIYLAIIAKQSLHTQGEIAAPAYSLTCPASLAGVAMTSRNWRTT